MFTLFSYLVIDIDYRKIPYDKKSCFCFSAGLQPTALAHGALALVETAKTGIETRSQFPHLIRQ